MSTLTDTFKLVSTIFETWTVAHVEHRYTANVTPFVLSTQDEHLTGPNKPGFVEFAERQR